MVCCKEKVNLSCSSWMFGSLESAPLVDIQDMYLLQKKERKKILGKERRRQILATSFIQMTLNHDSHMIQRETLTITNLKMFSTNITEVKE